MNRIIALVVIILMSLGASSAFAMSVTPIHIEMTSSGSGSRAQFKVANTGKVPLPVEIAVERFAMTEDGHRQTISKKSENFLFFPPQALIPPGATQVFRVQWLGDPLLNQSESYMATVNQIPVKLPSGKSAVQVVMSFGIVMNVAPPKGVGALSIVGTSVALDRKSGKRRPAISVSNSSAVHGLLTDATVRLSSGSWSATLPSGELAEKIGIGLVQPGKRRRFILPVDLPAGVTKVEATLDYRPKRR